MSTAIDADEPRYPEWTRGDRLRKARELAGFNQAQMGEHLAALNNGKPFKHSTIAAWERDLSQPRDLMAVIYRWAEITRVDAAWLLAMPPTADNPRSVNFAHVITDVPFTGQMELFGHPEDVMVSHPLELVKA